MLDNFSNLDQSELSHLGWLEYAETHKKRYGREPTDAERMTWKAAYRWGFCDCRKLVTAEIAAL